MSETIEKIKMSELKAMEIINNAETETKAILENAIREADNKYNEIILKAIEEGDLIIEEAIKRGNSKASPIIEKAEEESEKILNTNEEKIATAVNLIVNKVVVNDGNS